MATRTEDLAMNKTLATVFTLAFLTAGGPASAATPEELEARVNALAAQVVALQNEVAGLKAQKVAAATAPPTTVAATATTPSTDAQLQWFGYGEMNYSRPTGDAAAA